MICTLANRYLYIGGAAAPMPPKAKGHRPQGKQKCIGPNECFVPALKSLEKFIPIETQGKWNQTHIHTSSIGMASERMSIQQTEG